MHDFFFFLFFFWRKTNDFNRRKRVQFQPICEEEEIQEPNNEVFCDTNTVNTLEVNKLKQEISEKDEVLGLGKVSFFFILIQIH